MMRPTQQRVERIERVCPICGGSFDVMPARARQGRGTYCGAACQRENQRREFGHMNTSRLQAKIDAASSPDGRPTLTRADWSTAAGWWHDGTGIGRQCAECGGKHANELPGWERYGRVYCLQCGREPAWISGVGL